MPARTMLWAALPTVTLALSSGPSAGQAANLLTNGSLNEAGEGLAKGWMLQADVGRSSATRPDTGGADGGPYVEVTLAEKGQCDVRPTAGSVDLRPDVAYLLTAAVKASNAASGSHAAELQWFGEQGFISRDAAQATVAGRWTRVAVGPVKPPTPRSLARPSKKYPLRRGSAASSHHPSCTHRQAE